MNMKLRNNIIPGTLGVLLMTACSDAVEVHYDMIPDADQYTTIYMPQANTTPNSKSVFISTEVQSFPVTAFYGGVKLPANNVTVEFETRFDLIDAYNAAHGTNYLPMPEGSYALDATTAVIPAGTDVSSAIHVNLTTQGYLTVPQGYLLPIGIKQIGGSKAPVEEDLRVTYFLINGSYLPGQVPREKVYSFGHEVTLPIFTMYGSDLVRLDEGGGLQLFQVQADGTYANTRQIGWGWEGMQFMMYARDRIVVLNQWSNLTQYFFDANYNYQSQGDFGWGWGGTLNLFPFKDRGLVAITAAGDLNRFPMTDDGGWNYDGANGGYGTIASGWGSYPILFCSGNNVMSVDNAGNLWANPLSDTYALGTRRQAGTGWDIYTKLIPCGDDLLALDANGDLWRYKFSPDAFWPLKAEEEVPTGE
jgi:hypothetical protein